MSRSPSETPAPEANTLPGLSTPNLNSSASNAPRNTTNASTTEKKTTAFDIAHDIERELAKATELLDQNDKEISAKIDSTLKKRKLEEQTSNTSKNDHENDTTEAVHETNHAGPGAKEDHEHATPDIKIDENDPLLQQYETVLRKFNHEPTKEESQIVEAPNSNDYTHEETSGDSEDENDEEHGQSSKLSKRQSRLRNKVPLSSLKMSTHLPELVEPTDADAQDPYLLVFIKSQPNVIPVPSHWSSKRDYLSSKRGIERPPFQLPKFIRDTGIEEMRQTTGDDRTLKQQQRERVQVKLGRLDMDYEKLYRAFFHNQSKPRLSSFGELYEEGKELVDEMTNEAKKCKPGVVSKELRGALGMNENDLSIPPAWITIMKDIGKPPSYQDLIIPGIDEDYNNGGYRDRHADGDVNVEHWGSIKALVESESEGEDEEEEEEEENEGGESGDESESRNSIHHNENGIANDSDSEKEEHEVGQDQENKSSLKDVLINMFDDKAPPEVDDSRATEDATDKFLYQVLGEKKSDGQSLTGHAYDLDKSKRHTP
ncbi:sap145 [Candida margitis]|uniref:sap145 n=1 Tax=Candida margitis TaxID=1775924 RepID=UPI00222777C3|nr:sap145 [Candida margitis]KAI5963980.1 sap145 [Candida margitis]